jgi:hypothetical protein
VEQRFLPAIGSWYRSVDGDLFRVVAIDEDYETVEIQYLNGDVAELDFESLDELQLTPIAEPEDWSAPFDDLERDDLGYNSDESIYVADKEDFWREVDK